MRGRLRYLLIFIGLILFFVSFIVSMQTIQSSSDLLEEIKDKHYKLFSLTEQIRKKIQKHEADIYAYIIMKHNFKKEYTYSNLFNIDNDIDMLHSLIQNLKVDDALSVVERISKRLVAYSYIEKELLETFADSQEEDSIDAISAFSSVTAKFHEDFGSLTNLAKQTFLSGVKELTDSIDSAQFQIVFVLIGGTIIIVITFLNLIRHNKKYAIQLERAKLAEKKQYELQVELVAHSHSLEKEVEKKTKEVTYRYYHSSLSNLPNRYKLMEDIKKCKETKLMLVNIDKFQHFNDYFGTKRGDKAILQLANALDNMVDIPYRLYHMGADEFAVLAGDAVTQDSFEHYCQMLFDQVKTFELIELENRLLLNISAGIAMHEDDIFAKADIALKEAKKTKRGLVQYNEHKRIRENFLKNFNQVSEITQAINHNRIEIFLQPICHAADKKVYKYEVLARMINSSGQLVPPIEFLTVAKEARLYATISRMIFIQMLQLIETKQVKCSFNISIDDILDEESRELFVSRLSQFEYAEYVSFELLESENIEEYEEVRDFIEEVRALGASFAIDDFGTGYSNFDHLLHLDINYLKIDGSLVKMIEEDKASQLFVAAMVKFAKEMGIKTVAEYVSSESIYDQLVTYGIDFVQGYWLGKPEKPSFYLSS